MPFVPAQGRSKAADFGTLLGRGVGSGINEQISENLHHLAQQKLQTMQRRQQASAYHSVLGLDPNKAYELTAFPQDVQLALLENPSILSQLRGQQAQMDNNPSYGAPQQIEPMQGLDYLAATSGMPRSNIQDLLRSSGINLNDLASVKPLFGQTQFPQPSMQGAPGQMMPEGQFNQAPQEQLNLRNKPLNALQREQLKTTQTKRDILEKGELAKLEARRDKILDFVSTAERALDNLKSGKVKFGNPIHSITTSNQITSALAPQATEDWANDAYHLYNLATEGLKGIMSKARLNILGSDKLNVGRSKDVNEKILKRYLAQGKQEIADLYKKYPELKEDVLAQQPSVQTPAPAQNAGSGYEGPMRGTPQNPEKWDPSIGAYRPAKKRG